MEAQIKITDPLLALSALIIATIFLYLPTTNSFVDIWTDQNNPTYSHGPLLLLISVFFIFRIWQKKENDFIYQPNLAGIVLLIATSLLWFFAHLGHIQFVQQIALLFIIVFTFLSLLAYQQTKLFLVPLLLLLFAIPIWDFTNTFLREIAVYAVVYLLNLSGILSISEGFSILIPAGIFEIVRGCSGQGQLVVALAISCMYTYLHPMQWYFRIIFILAAALIAIITNVLRIYIVVVSGQYTNMQHYFVTTDHVMLGWVVFSIGMLIYFIIANRLLDRISPLPLSPELSSEPSKLSSSSVTKNESSLHKQAGSSTSTKSRIPYEIVLLVIFSISIGPMLAHYYETRTDDINIGSTQTRLIGEFANWENRTVSGSDYRVRWQPVFNGADQHQHAIYQSSNGTQVEVNRYHYIKQKQGKEAVSDDNAVYQDNQWKFISRKVHKFDVNQKSISVEATVIESPDKNKKLILKWYQVLNVRTQHPVVAKLLNIWGVITHQPDISVYVIAGDINNSYTDTLEALQQFVSDFSTFAMTQ